MFPFKVTTKLGESEHLAFNEAVTGTRRKILMAIGFIGTAAFVYLTLRDYITLRVLRPGYITLAILYLVLALYPAVIVPALTKKRVREHIARNGETTINYEFFEDRLDESFERKTGSGTTQISYSGLIKVIETERFFILFATDTAARMVYKNAMTPEQAEALRAALKNYVPEKKYVIRSK